MHAECARMKDGSEGRGGRQRAELNAELELDSVTLAFSNT